MLNSSAGILTYVVSVCGFVALTHEFRLLKRRIFHPRAQHKGFFPVRENLRRRVESSLPAGLKSKPSGD